VVFEHNGPIVANFNAIIWQKITTTSRVFEFSFQMNGPTNSIYKSQSVSIKFFNSKFSTESYNYLVDGMNEDDPFKE
jgi:hypothetical protein